MQNTIQYIQNQLEGLYPATEIRSFSFLIVEKLTGFSRTEIILNKNTTFSDQQRHLAASFIEKLKNNVPIQYILGETEFYGLDFAVNESVLIPRPETEELVEWILADNANAQKMRILDIGTGSGCIAISLKHQCPDASVTGFDISRESLKTARLNALKHGLTVSFEEVDILSGPVFFDGWDVIVSNPPYIPRLEMAEIQPNVLDYEPHLALFVPDDDPLIFYRHIGLFALKHLLPGGKLYVEIHRDAAQSCEQLFRELGFAHVEVRKDIAGNDRMVKAELTPQVVYSEVTSK